LFNPINLDYFFCDQEDPFNLWLSEKEQLVFEGEDFNWLNFNENEINAAITGVDCANQLPDATPPLCYSTYQQPQDILSNESKLEGHLSPRTSHDGSGGGGFGGDGGNGGGGDKETEVHMRLVTLICLGDQLITLMIVMDIMPLLKMT